MKAHLQKEITKHRETAAAEKLTGEMKDLMRTGTWGQIKPGDLRANAYLSCDKLSSQFLLALPNRHYFLEPIAFSDAFARYLGAPLPSIVRGGLVGHPMPCNALSGEGRRKGRVCDAHGHQMELAKLRDNTVCLESTALEKTIHEVLRHAGYDARWQDKTMFKATRAGERPALVPDITVRMAMGDEAPVLEYLMDVKTVRLGGVYNTRANYDKVHGAMDARGEMVQREYLAKARMADSELARGANYNYSDSDTGEEDGDMHADADHTPPAHSPGPVEMKLRAHPPPVGLCFGTYGEGSEGVHVLVDRIAHKLAEERGEELGCDKERVLGLFKHRTRCALGVAAVRARAVARAARRPLVGCTTVQANRLLAGSCSAHTSLKNPGQGGLQLLTAMTWREDAGSHGPRGLRGD